MKAVRGVAGVLVTCLVSLSGQSFCVSGPLMESIFHLVAEWIPLKDMVQLYEVSSTESSALKEWFEDQILDSCDHKTWTDMSEEWTDFYVGYCENW